MRIRRPSVVVPNACRYSGDRIYRPIRVLFSGAARVLFHKHSQSREVIYAALSVNAIYHFYRRNSQNAEIGSEAARFWGWNASYLISAGVPPNTPPPWRARSDAPLIPLSRMSGGYSPFPRHFRRLASRCLRRLYLERYYFSKRSGIVIILRRRRYSYVPAR